LRRISLSTGYNFDANEFYLRQTVLKELGMEGQNKLRQSKVAVIGLGGLGSASTLYLALAGVGYLRLLDQDTVEMNNLHRQILYTLRDLKYSKVEAAAERIRETNPEVKVDPRPENLREDNVDEIVRGVDCVVDGLDNMRTRYIVSRACVRNNVPFIFGGAIGFEGNISVFHPPETPCLECVLPNLNDQNMPTCDVRGVLGATAGIVGTIQAMEAVKLLAAIGETLKNKLLVCDFKDMYMATVEIHRRPNCNVCGDQVSKALKMEEKLAWLCGRNTVNINPPSPVDLDLERAKDELSRHFRIILISSIVVVFKYAGDIEVSLFKSGRMLVKNVKSEEDALQVYRETLRALGIGTTY